MTDAFGLVPAYSAGFRSIGVARKLVSSERAGLTGQNLWLRRRVKEKTFGLNAKNAGAETIVRV
jgi:hypothetical protein